MPFFGEMLSEHIHETVVVYYESAVLGVQRRQPVNEYPGVLVNGEHLERLAEKHTLYKGGFVGSSRFLKEGEKHVVLCGIKPHDVAVGRRIELGRPASLIKLLFHKNGD